MKLKAAIELILPLLGQVPGTNNKAALQITPGNQLFDQETGHNGFAGARIVG